MYLRILVCLLCLFLSFDCALASGVIISEVFYNPVGTDSGKEFVVFYNPTSSAVNLEDYVFETGNGANANDWTIEWTGTSHDVLQPSGYLLIGESDVLPTPDFVTDLDLQNGPDACRLRKSNAIIDVVGWGALQFPEYYESSPAALVREGFSLSRVDNADTGNNDVDFTEALPNPRSAGNDALTIIIKVTEPTLQVAAFMVSDDDLLRSGSQILPMPGANVSVNLSVNVFVSNNSISQVVASSNRKSYALQRTLTNSSQQRFAGSIIMEYSDSPGNYTVNITASSQGKSGSSTVSFEYLPMTALFIDTASVNFTTQPNTLFQSIGDLDIKTKNKPTIRNIGNVAFDVGVLGSNLTSSQGSIDLHNIELSFSSDFKSSVLPLSESLQYVALALSPAHSKELSYRVFVPEGTSEGIYSGHVMLTARPS
ncbi:MAG: lamin tail domain-containing protein [Candidatus Woesearchaeota archaeon]